MRFLTDCWRTFENIHVNNGDGIALVVMDSTWEVMKNGEVANQKGVFEKDSRLLQRSGLCFRTVY